MVSNAIRRILWREASAKRRNIPAKMPSLNSAFPPPAAAHDRILLADPGTPPDQRVAGENEVVESQELWQTILEMRKRRDFTGELVDGSKVVRNRRRFPYMARLTTVFVTSPQGRNDSEVLSPEARAGYPPNIRIKRCSGTLVHPEFVLTAASCLVSKGSTATDTTVTLGDLNVDVEEGTEVRRVVQSSAFVIPSYFEEIGSRVFNDVALIRLSPPVNTITKITWRSPRQPQPLPLAKSYGWDVEHRASYIRPIQLARHFTDDYTGDVGSDVGAEVLTWGRRSRLDNTEVLTATSVPVRHAAVCWLTNGFRRWTNAALSQICYGGGIGRWNWARAFWRRSDERTSRGICMDDSGAPIVKMSPNANPDEDIQIGIVSYSPEGQSNADPTSPEALSGACSPYTPRVATRVSYFFEWFVKPWLDQVLDQTGDGGNYSLRRKNKWSNAPSTLTPIKTEIPDKLWNLGGNENYYPIYAIGRDGDDDHEQP